MAKLGRPEQELGDSSAAFFVLRSLILESGTIRETSRRMSVHHAQVGREIARLVKNGLLKKESINKKSDRFSPNWETLSKTLDHQLMKTNRFVPIFVKAFFRNHEQFDIFRPNSINTFSMAFRVFCLKAGLFIGAFEPQSASFTSRSARVEWENFASIFLNTAHYMEETEKLFAELRPQLADSGFTL